jgi:hypothetical protein
LAAVEGFVWSPASDVFYISFRPLMDSLAVEGQDLTYVCDLSTGASSALGTVRWVRDANVKGDLVGLTLDYGSGGLASSSYADPSVTIWHDGELTPVEPVTQTTFGPLFISADGESVVLQGDAYDESQQVYNVLEIMRHADGSWASDRV